MSAYAYRLSSNGKTDILGNGSEPEWPESELQEKLIVSRQTKKSNPQVTKKFVRCLF